MQTSSNSEPPTLKRQIAWIVSFGPVGSASDGYLVRVEANARALAGLGVAVNILEVSERAGAASPWQNVEIHPAWPTGLPKRGLQGPFDLGAEIRAQIALVRGLLHYWKQLRSADLVVIEGGMLALALVVRLLNRGHPFFVFDLHTLMSSVHRDPPGLCTARCKVRRLVWLCLEFLCIKSSHLTITCSQEDADRMRARRVAVVPHSVPTTTLFRQLLEDPDLVGFVGSGSLSPNREAVEFIGTALLAHPRLESVRCRVIGQENGYRRNEVTRIEFVGFHEDLSKALSPISVCCAPMTQTGGVSTKVLAYLAGGKRTVCTAEAARGIALPPEGLWIAERPQFADAVAKALASPWPPKKGQALRNWMSDHHGPPAVRDAWRRVLTNSVYAHNQDHAGVSRTDGLG